MNFAHDPENGFYYYGSEAPKAGMYRHYLIDNQPSAISADVETISLKERIALGVGIAVSPEVSFYFPLFPEMSRVVPWYLLKDPKVKKVFHNAPFDLLCMREYEITNENIVDTNVLAHLLSITPSRLSDVMAYVGTHGGKLREVHDAGDFLKRRGARTMLDVDPNEVARKCTQDCIATYEVYNNLIGRVDKEYFDMEMQALTILVDMSFRGILIDQEVRERIEEKLKKEVSYLNSLCEGEGFSPGSPQQVGYMLAKRGAYSVFNRIPMTRKSKQLDTSEEILNKMSDPMATITLQYRAASKLLSTYIKPWTTEERAYTRFHMDAITGRPSSTERNLQNIPKGETRGIFIPDDGMFSDFDFSQLELRILAYLSQDKEMLRILNDPKGDIHQETADFMGIPRNIAKNVGFAMIYGGTDETITETAHLLNVSKGRELREGWFEKYRDAGYWIHTKQEEALKDPFATTLFGRKIRLPSLEMERRDGIQRKAVNYPIQGTGAEILKRALIKCKDLDMLLTVHDEILVNGKVDVPDLSKIAPFWTPVETKYLLRWE